MPAMTTSPRRAAPSKPTSRLQLSTKLFYGFGSVAYGVKDNGFAYLLLLYYNQVLGLPQIWVGAGILIALVIDSISDPIVGYASDNLNSRWGRRHPFMYAAAVPVAISYYFLFSPPAGLSDGALFAYFVTIAVLVRTFITFYEIPSTSLVSELTDDYDERTSLVSYRYFFGWWGGLTMSVLAFSVFLQPDAEHSVGVLNKTGYRQYGLAASALMVFAILVSAIGTHRHIPNLKSPPERKGGGLSRTVSEMRETFSNRSFVVLFISGIFWAMAAGLSAALNIYFTTFFWELSSDQISTIVLANFISAAIALVVSPVLSKNLGKKTAAMTIGATALTLAPAPILGRLIGWMPENGSPWLMPILVGHSIIEIGLIIVTSILVSAMVADIVEDSELSTGRRSEGMFFAARSFVQKSVSGVGIFTSTIILGMIDFPRDAQPGEVPAEVVSNLGKVYIPIILLLYGAGLACIGPYNISRETHAENLKQLAAATND